MHKSDQFVRQVRKCLPLSAAVNVHVGSIHGQIDESSSAHYLVSMHKSIDHQLVSTQNGTSVAVYLANPPSKRVLTIRFFYPGVTLLPIHKMFLRNP